MTIMTQIRYYTMNIGMWFANINLIGVLSSIIAFFAPISLFIHLILFAVLIDLITGIISSYIQKVKIVSHRLRHTFIKLFVYIGLLMLMYGIQNILWNIPISNIIAVAILFTEAYSLCENIDIITNGRTNFAGIIKQFKKLFNKENKTNIKI